MAASFFHLHLFAIQQNILLEKLKMNTSCKLRFDTNYIVIVSIQDKLISMRYTSQR